MKAAKKYDYNKDYLNIIKEGAKKYDYETVDGVNKLALRLKYITVEQFCEAEILIVGAYLAK